jgi:hypothetical protein
MLFSLSFRACLANTVQYNEEAEVKCPYRDAEYACNSVLQEREIKAVSEITFILVTCCCTTEPPRLQVHAS